MVGVYAYKITSRGKMLKFGLTLAMSLEDAWIKASYKCNKKMLLKHGKVTGTVRSII